MKTAIYPGTFDPITFGHIDVIKKGLKLFDKIIVAVSDVDNKDYLFDSAERIQIIKNALFLDFLDILMPIYISLSIGIVFFSDFCSIFVRFPTILVTIFIKFTKACYHTA